MVHVNVGITSADRCNTVYAKALWSLIFEGFENTGYKATWSPQMQLLWSISAQPTAVN